MDFDRINNGVFPAKADPSPCERCRHRQDLHELYRGMRYCRMCQWVGTVWPCSMHTLGQKQTLDALSFDLEL